MTAFYRPCGKFFQPGLENRPRDFLRYKGRKNPRTGTAFFPSKENSLPGNENLRKKIVCLRRVG